jgi:hypothetical protein
MTIIRFLFSTYIVAAFFLGAATLRSPIPSTVKGITIRNTHLLAEENGVVLRGMEPRSSKEVGQLVKFGITDVLIFRNDVAADKGNKGEEHLLKEAGIQSVHKIPFKWKDLSGFKTPCRQTVQALKLIRQALATPHKGLFFNCTVGEDRTGYLAGLYRVIFENKKPEDVFENEMCKFGYAEGDSTKPPAVVATVHENITPLYLKMAALAHAGRLTPDHLDERACDEEPDIQIDLTAYRCAK